MRAKEIQPKKLVVFDIDDTLVNTQTKVHVIKDGQIIKSLNSHDFTHYKLQPGESFDFEDFRNAREFFEKSKPIIPMMRQLKQDIATGNKVVMVTARADFDDKELFLDTFRKYGVDIDKVHVYRAGNSKQGTTEERKKAIIKHLLDKDDYSKAIMYDDAKPNLHTFIELKQDHPQTKFYAWHVSPEGAASEYMREGVVAEKKRRRKPRWAAYGPGPYGGYGYATGYSGDSGGDVGEDQHPNERPRGPETKPTMPKGTVKVDVSDVYDWYKLGQHISDLKGLGKHDFGKGPPSAILSFGDEDLEHEYIKALMKTGLTTTDIDPVDPKQPKGMKRQKVDPTYNVGETVIDADALVDVFIRGKHKGQTMTKLVARDFPNRSIPMLIKALEKKHGINPKAVVYGPSSKQDMEENFVDGRKFVEPNFSNEWEEAERYPEFVKLGKDAWIKLAKKGKAITINSAQDINNTDAADPDSFKLLHPEKQKRALAQLEKGIIEMPIVAVYSDGQKELIGGNTRLTAMMARDGKATIWTFQVPGKQGVAENFADGKVKGKSRPGRVKAAGASCDGSVTDLRKRAKNASGEKAKMYHWCANMKSGR
jgi:hypothetical protein